MQGKTRDYNIDLIKIIACIFVVVLHTIGKQLNWINDSIYYMAGCAIPLFFMVNGSLIMKKKEVTYKYVTRKIVNILLIIILWNILYCIFQCIILHKNINLIKEIFKNLFLQRGYLSHFWFLGALIIIYSILPFIHKYFSKGKKQAKIIMIIFIGCSFFMYCFMIWLTKEKSIILKDVVPQTLRIWTSLSYFIFGGYIYKYIDFKNFNTKMCICIYVVTLILNVLYDQIMANKVINNFYVENFYDSIIMYGYSFATYALIKSIKLSEKMNTRIDCISKYTMGIYIIHYIIIMNLKLIYDFKNAVLNILIFIIVFFVSLLITKLISKNSVLRKLVQM